MLAGICLISLLGRSVLGLELQDRVSRKQQNQEKSRADAGEEQASERLLRRNRIEDHGDRRRQQDAQRSAGRDDARGKAAGISALAHLRDAGRADRGAGCRRRSCHCRE